MKSSLEKTIGTMQVGQVRLPQVSPHELSPNKVVLGRTLEHAKTAAIHAGLDKPT